MKKITLCFLVAISNMVILNATEPHDNNKKVTFYSLDVTYAKLKDEVQENIKNILPEIEKNPSSKAKIIQAFYYKSSVQKYISSLLFIAIKQLQKNSLSVSYTQEALNTINSLQETIDQNSSKNELTDLSENIKKLFLLLLAL